jgi:protease IV
MCTAWLAAACSTSSSRLDPVVGSAATDDPWAAPATSTKKADKDDGGGFDIQGLLKKVAENVSKPGPYEAPEKSKDYDEHKPHWNVLEVDGDVVERTAYSWRGGRGTELRKLIDRLRAFAKDDQVAGVLLRVEPLEISLPDVIELRAALHDVRAAGKGLACHTEEAANATYLALTACERLAVAPLGQIAVTGPAAMPIHVKPLLDKLGVTADFLHVGAYKGAAEPLTRDSPSREMEETLGAILDRHYQTMIDIIAKDRRIEPPVVKALIDTALFPADQAKASKLVDEVAGFEAFRDQVVKTPWTVVELDESSAKDQLKAMLRLARFIGAMPPDRPVGEHVALVYAIGNIVDGDGSGVLGARQQIASHTLVATLRALTADASVKAVVLRIDSGGGSAQASELIWRAVAELKDKKPVVVSMSDVAASGGYYIAAGATKIFALEDTLTGSIGVVGGKIAPSGALAKLGINTFPMGRGKRATMMASLAPWSDDEKGAIKQTMDDVYRTFVGRVAAGRNKTPAEIDGIAQGRVWTGAKAKQLGLVDAIGGLDAALDEAHKLAKLEPAELEIYPPAPTLRDMLHGFSGVQTPFGLAELRAAAPEVADGVEHLVELVMSFRSTQIQAIAVLPEIR